MIKRTIMLSLALVFSMSSMVFASPLDDVLVELASTEADVQKINYEVSTIEEEIKSTKEKVSSVQKNIESNEIEIKILEENISDKEKEIFDKAKLTYMNTSNPNRQYLEVLLNSKNIKDFAQRFFVVREIMSSDKKKLNSFNDNKNEIELKQSEVRLQKKELEKSINDLNAKLESLVSKKEEKESKILEYKELKTKYEKEIKENEMKIAASLQDVITSYVEVGNTVNKEENVYENVEEDEIVYEEEIVYDEVESVPDTSDEIISGNQGNSGADTSFVVGIAFKYLGVPYVWGGTTPAGFDCSGFVQYVYREAGINISRTTYTQIAEGYPVSDLQPGDLVFFGSYSAPYHVGIYIGNGQYIHSPMEGDVVKVAELQYRGDYCGARRYL